MQNQIWLGTRKGLFSVAKDSCGWHVKQVYFPGIQIPIFLVDGDQIWAALQHGHFGAKVQHSSDAGANWREIATPVYPAKPEDAPEVIDPIRKTAIPWSLDMIWSLERSIDGKLWCGTLPGGLFSSDDAGESWQLNRPLWNLPNRARWFGGGYDLPGIHSICAHPSRAMQLAIGISCGGVWMTQDSGVTWEARATGMRAEYVPPEQAFDPDIQDPHRLVQCKYSPDHFWVQHHNGIFYSDDACQSWQEIPAPEPSGFGFAVAVHPSQPATAWFVPAVADSDRYPQDGKFVVNRTIDAGKSFETLTRGLPQVHAYHLVYRHALDISEDGNCLAMGSTTGACWISEDGGDHWQTISQDLPPIFSVRFPMHAS